MPFYLALLRVVSFTPGIYLIIFRNGPLTLNVKRPHGERSGRLARRGNQNGAQNRGFSMGCPRRLHIVFHTLISQQIVVAIPLRLSDLRTIVIPCILRVSVLPDYLPPS